MEKQTLILAYANKLAKDVGFKQVIKPVKTWKRPTTQVELGVWTMTSAGILTAAETCAITNFRLNYQLVAEGAKSGMLIVFAKMSQLLGVESVGEVIELIQDTAARQALMEEKGVDFSHNDAWTNELEEVNNNFDIPAAQEVMEEHLITFIMAMRCDPEWDYENTLELSAAERAEILDFVAEEEGVVADPEAIEQEDENRVSVKKP